MDGTVINLCDSDSDSDDSLLGLGKRFKPASREKQLDKNMNSTTLHTSTHTSNTQIAVPQHEAKTSIINSEHLGERSPTTNQTMVDLPRNSDTDDDDSSQEFAHLPVYRPKINLSQGSNSSGVADDNANTNTNIQCSRKDNQDKDDSVIEILDETLDETTMNMHSSFAHTLGIQKPVTTTTTTTATEVSLSRNNSSSSSSPNSKKHESVLAIAKRPRNEQLPPSPNRDNEKSETDCIILLSSDDELQTPNFKSKSKSNSNRYTALKRLQDLSDSDDDELMSSAPFLQSTLHRDKKVCLPSSSNDESQTSAFGQERSGCNSPIGLGAQWQSPRGSLKDDRNYEYDCARYSSTFSRCLTSDKGCSMASGTKWEMDSILATSHAARVKATAFDDSDSEDDALLSQQIFTTSSTSVKHEKRDQSSSTKVRKEKNKTPNKSGQTNSVRNNVNAPLPLHQRTTSQVENRGFEIESDDDLVTESRRVSFQSRPLQESRTTIAIATGTNSALAARVTQPPLLETNNNTVDFGGLDLMSPVASRGRPSVGSAMSSSSARKVKVPTPAIPVANEIGGKLYPDLRNQFIKELIRNAKLMRRATYQKGALDGSIRAINSLALYQFPIRTAEGAQAIKGIGGELIGVLKDAQKAVKKNELPYNPPAGKFASAAAAALVILLDHEAGKTDADRCLSMEDLMMRINQKAHCTTGGRLFNRETDYYLDKKNLDPSWMQIRKLCSSGFMKERKRKKACTSGLIYELEEVGRQEARHLKARLSQGSIPKGPLRQLAAHTVLEEFGNITIVMDFREGGGGRHKLHEMCGFMDEHEIPYVVRDLKISDYVFFVGDKLVPVLIERKSIEDVASSLHDGRWERQQRNMRKAQYVLGGGDERKCHICYLIEGDIDRTTVHGGFVGRSAYRKTVQDVKDAIESLPSLGFSVIESKNKFGSLEKIKRVAKDFLWRANNGSIDCTHTYDKFLDEVKHLGNDKGEPPTDPRHKNPAPPIIDEMPPTATAGGANVTESTDNNIEVSEDVVARREELMKLSMKELKDMCKERAEKMSGSKKDVVQRLLQQRNPEILISRARRNQYVPKVPSCNASILVALHLHHEPGTKALTKEKIMMFAEESGVNKDPMFGNGKGWYDGWSGFKDLTGGDPSLVSDVKRKYALTTQPTGSAGVDVAKAVHIVAHRQGICRCGRFVDTS